MEDSAILALYWSRDERAIPETEQKYGNYLTAIAMRILENTEDTEECVNDTYLAAWNAIPPQKPSRFGAFLGKITRNLSLNRFRDRTAEKRGGTVTALALAELGDIVSQADDTEAFLDRDALTEAINGFLGSLSTEKRNLFIRRYWYFDTIPEIARRYHKSENNVTVTLSRLRKALRSYLTERGFTV